MGFIKGKSTTDAAIDLITKTITALDVITNKAVGVFLNC